MDKKQHLIWIDLEMTGLIPESDRIIEIATIITNTDLQVIDEGPVLAIHQPKKLMDGMDEWNQTHHGPSGLVERVRLSPNTEADAEKITIKFLSKYCDRGFSPMCGNSIGQDRRFLVRYMPALEAFFHYRNLDVSTIKELAKRWRPDIMEKMTKQSTHQALQDIRDSIDELRVYREHFFNTTKP